MLPHRFSKDSDIRLAVLFAPPPVQLLDLAPVDLFHMLSREYLGGIEFLPKPIKDLALEKVQIHYIADLQDASVVKLNQSTSNGDNVSIAPLTAQASLRAVDIDTPEVQPGKSTILIVPGPDPTSKPSQRSMEFMRAHASCGTTDIITVCTGIYPACYSGICDDKKVSGPRGLQSDLSTKFKKVQKFEDKRWSRDNLSSTATDNKSANGNVNMRPAELWTGAGITNGNDCIAAYIRAHFNSELGEIIIRMADVGDRPKEYDVGRFVESTWWVTKILTAAIKGLWRKS